MWRIGGAGVTRGVVYWRWRAVSAVVYSGSGEVKRTRGVGSRQGESNSSSSSNMWRRRGLSTVPPLCLPAKRRRVSATPLGPSYGLGHDAHASCPLEHAVAIGMLCAARHHAGLVQGHALYAKLPVERRPP